MFYVIGHYGKKTPRANIHRVYVEGSYERERAALSSLILFHIVLMAGRMAGEGTSSSQWRVTDKVNGS